MLYHGTHYNFDKGFEIKPQNEYTSNKNSSELEDLFEKEKPDEMISRKKAVFLCDSPENIDNCGGYTDVIYVVSTDYEERSDLAWYSKAQEYLEECNLREAKKCAQKYWSGEIFENNKQSCYEIRCNSAIILSTLELNVEKEELTIIEKKKVKDILLKKQIEIAIKKPKNQLTK